MSKKRQKLRVMFECIDAGTANSVVFSLSARTPFNADSPKLFQHDLSGIHSTGRFVFVNAFGDQLQVYKHAKEFSRDHRAGVSLVGITGDDVAWDYYNLQLLEHGDNESWHVPLFNNARKFLAGDFLKRHPARDILQEDLWDIVAECCLYKLPTDCAHGLLDALCEGVRELDTCENAEAVIIQCESLNDRFSKALSYVPCGSNAGIRVMWRILVHLLQHPELRPVYK